MVATAATVAVEPDARTSGGMVIEIGKDHRVIVDAGVDAAALAILQRRITLSNRVPSLRERAADTGITDPEMIYGSQDMLRGDRVVSALGARLVPFCPTRNLAEQSGGGSHRDLIGGYCRFNSLSLENPITHIEATAEAGNEHRQVDQAFHRKRR
jgi:hypothetical protein